ncbi:MAG TPA: cytochrome c3 family protein [Candidatus Sulfotelmatobacter sp.]|nr:cytochrome c3 family protein [Candidatus Sulfotelmatobacter sp.]
MVCQIHDRASSQALRPAVRRYVYCLLAFAAFWAFPALANTHPVPLDKNVDAKKCLECHEDKSKGKFVHTAVSTTGCLSCHEVRVNKDVTRVKLITAVPYKVCLTCHSDKDASQIQGHVHEPAVRNCLQCHDPHVSDNKNQLLKATAGEKKDNLCLTCHDQGQNVPEKGSRHAALDMGCDTCHVTHKTGKDLTTENQFHLIKAAPQLCIDCHDVKDESLQKAHNNQPFGTTNCMQCHDPHSSASPKLMAKFQHPPFADKSCEMCHAPPKDGKVVLTQADAKSLCVTCHDDQAKKIETAKVAHPGAQAGDCLDCHNPHASSQPNLPKTDAVNICLGCHSDIADLHKKTTLHQPVFEQGCSTCHDGHGNDNPHLLRVANTNKLCLECHGPDSRPQKLEKEHLVAIFDGSVKLPENYFAKVPVLPLKYNTGHPVEGHPISDVVDPSDITKVKTQINCLTCHQPHASAQPGLLAKDQANNALFCANCHKNLQK